MTLIDQKERDEILKDDGNIAVSASAGSGKTTIMVKKMEIELGKITNHKTVAAITFTVKAANEIREKAAKYVSKSFTVMTNDSFIESEIIRPFIKDALGNEYNNDYITEYESKYKFTSYEAGLEQLRSSNILGSFVNRYDNFNFRLAYEILKTSIAAQEYIKSKYSCIFIDEYQDSDMDMHSFFMFLKNKLGIKLFIVGDSKQAVYLWRGAVRDIFELVKKENFNFYELVTNFRCHKEIENYANLFHNPKCFVRINTDVDRVIFRQVYSNNNQSYVNEFENTILDNNIDLDKEITIISNVNNDAENITNLLNQKGYDFVFIPRTPIDEGIPNRFLLKELALFAKNPSYTIYDFLEQIQINERKSTRLEVNEIIKTLKNNGNLDEIEVENVLSNLANYLQISINNDEINRFYQSICNNKYEMAFRLTDSKHKVMTVFGAKGLEFDQVISLSSYYQIYNNRDVQSHYVCITRAKEKFIMFINDERYFSHVEEVARNNGVENINNIISCK